MSTSPPAGATATFTCDCDRWVRSACEGLPFYKEHESKRYCVLHYPGKDKTAEFNEALKRKLEAHDFDFRGVWFPDVVDFSNFAFTAPTYFADATFSADASFNSATFSADASFNSATFSADANFRFATFSADATFALATFSDDTSFYYATFNFVAYFNYATFNARTFFDYATFSGAGAYFARATFSAEVYFYSAAFSANAYFQSATFSAEASFHYTKFSAEADFGSATFNTVVSFPSTAFNAMTSFNSAIFKDYARFAGSVENKVFGDNSSLNLQFARIEKPERFSFHTVTLRPHWFVNVDSRKFEFVAVEWNWNKIKGRQEIKSLQSKKISPAHNLLELACRNLAVNAEENHRYERASKFRYMAMDVRRLEGWQGWRDFASWLLNWWYWLASGYGERIGKAFIMLVGVWLLAAVLYTGVGFVRWEPRVGSEQEAATARRDVVGEPLKLLRALTYSLGVMALQKPEPRPATNWAQAVVMLETILGPVQAALLALAIRRKFMR